MGQAMEKPDKQWGVFKTAEGENAHTHVSGQGYGVARGEDKRCKKEMEGGGKTSKNYPQSINTIPYHVSNNETLYIAPNY